MILLKLINWFRRRNHLYQALPSRVVYSLAVWPFQSLLCMQQVLVKVFVIAEAGVNHNGSLEICKKLIDISVKAGADAVKFQTINKR